MAHRLRAVRPAPAVEPPGRPLCPRGRGSRPLHARRPGRRGERPTGHLTGWQGILQADAYAGYNQLYGPERLPGPVASALCWSHARRKFFELANVESNIRKGKNAKEISPIAFDAVRRIDALFDIERDLDGFTPADRLEARQRLSAPLVADLERWLRGERASLSKHAKVAKAIDYLLSPNHWPGFTRFLEDGRVCLTTNAAERSLRGVALGRTSWLLVGVAGFEPTTPASRRQCSTMLSYTPTVSARLPPVPALCKGFGGPAIVSVCPRADVPTGPDPRRRRGRIIALPRRAVWPQRRASSAASTASPMPRVETGVPPSGPIRSAVRTPSASTCSTACSSRTASSPRSKE